MVKIREAKIDDYTEIYKLNCNEMGYEYSEAKTKEKIEKILCSSRDKVFVAEVDNAVVEYIHANDYDLIYAPHMKNIMGIAVSSQYKKQGIGKMLLSAVEKWARQCNAEGIRLVSGAERSGAHEFYSRCGYIEDKHQIKFKKMF